MRLSLRWLQLVQHAEANTSGYGANAKGLHVVCVCIAVDGVPLSCSQEEPFGCCYNFGVGGLPENPMHTCECDNCCMSESRYARHLQPNAAAAAHAAT